MDPTNTNPNSNDQSNSTPTPPPAPRLTTLALLTAAVGTASQPIDKPSRMYTVKDGFRGLDGLNGISNDNLAVMSAACQRQIALNGGDDVATFLGTDKQPGLLTQYGLNIVSEAAAERKINTYLEVAADLKIEREPGEAASAFIARVQRGFAAANAQSQPQSGGKPAKGNAKG